LNQNALHELACDGMTWLAGERPGTAIRVAVETCPKGGCAHLDQMAHSPTLGWYRQRRFTVPRSMVGDLARLLRMSDCMTSQPEAVTSNCGMEQADANCEAGEPAHQPLPFPGPNHRSTHHDPQQRSG